MYSHVYIYSVHMCKVWVHVCSMCTCSYCAMNDRLESAYSTTSYLGYSTVLPRPYGEGTPVYGCMNFQPPNSSLHRKHIPLLMCCFLLLVFLYCLADLQVKSHGITPYHFYNLMSCVHMCLVCACTYCARVVTSGFSHWQWSRVLLIMWSPTKWNCVKYLG